MKKTTSPAKIHANRKNALKSTGPKTPKGKQTVKWNALKHGLLSKELVIRSGDGKENAADFQAVASALHDDLQPVGILEEMLVEKIAVCYWRLRRVIRCEVGHIRSKLDTAAFRLAINRIDNVRDTKPRSYLSPVMYRLMKSSVGIDKLTDLLDDLRAEVEERGYLCEKAVKDLRETFGVEDETFGFWAFFFHWTASKGETSLSEEERKKQDLPDPEKAKIALLDLIDEEKERLSIMREAVVENEEWQEESTLASLSLPCLDSLDKINRYETSIERQFYRAIGELDRLQKQRQGHPLPPTVNVQVSSDL